MLGWLSVFGALGACAEAAPAPAGSEAVRAPLAHISFSSSRGPHTLRIEDRLPLFDRVAFSSPSAILYDEQRDLYWVSNLNLDGATGTGFISRLEPSAAVSTLNFIDGQRPGIELKAPHGLAAAGPWLFVADVTAIRKFSAETGAPEGSVEIPGARYLSDVAVGKDGSLFVTDVGSDPNLAPPAAGSADAVYQISARGEITTIARRRDLGGPFAILSDDRGLWITCTTTSELLLLVPSPNGTPSPDAGRLPLPGSAPRGIAAMPDGTLLISSRADRAVYRGFRDGPFQPVITGLEAPADLDYDTRRSRLLIPLLTGHAVAIFDLPPLPERARPVH